MKNPLVSIIIPSYNRAHLLSIALESVLSQSYENWQLIICDDRSTDNSLMILEEFAKKDSRIAYYVRPEDSIKGANTCRNIGFEKAKGAFVKWMDSDDILFTDCIKKQLESILGNEDSAVTFCRTGYFKQKKGNKKQFIDKQWCSILTSENVTQDLITGKLRWQTMSGLWRRENLTEKPFKEGLMNSQEWLFHIEFSLKNLPFTTLDETLTAVGLHQGSMSDAKNKKSSYYYHASLARYFAYELVNKRKPSGANKVKSFLLKRFSWYHLFTFYKGGLFSFIKLFAYYPKMLFK